MTPSAEIDSLRGEIARLERALWADGLHQELLGAYQQAWRDLEELLSRQAEDPRHHFVVVIPVADSPRHLHSCLQSLLQQLQAFGYGGMREGRYPKVSVLLADDSADPQIAAENRRIAAEIDHLGLPVEYFGLSQQLALLDKLGDLPLADIIGRHDRDAFGHKGQGMMRNIAYLRLAELQAERPGQRLLFYTIDVDQRFEVKVATADGGSCVGAINYFAELDRLFDHPDLRILTGKVVGDPPVSPAVMAGKFCEDVSAFLGEMAESPPQAGYRQPAVDARGSGEANYHDMAEMFGFRQQEDAYRFRCSLAGEPTNADAFAEFAGRLNSFFHGEHPTRITWYRYQEVAASLQPARTIYTGNYVFTPQALDWFIPFAPLRLRMSGPTMGRILKATLGAAFASANVPMLHSRTLAETGQAEFRPGVVAEARQVDLADEFERQFFGDVMLFTMEALTGLGYPQMPLTSAQLGDELDRVQAAMRERYRARQGSVLERLTELQALLRDPAAWWNRSAELAGAVTGFAAFLGNIERNFGSAAEGYRRIEDAGVWSEWRARQLRALTGLPADREAWRQAVARLRRPSA